MPGSKSTRGLAVLTRRPDTMEVFSTAPSGAVEDHFIYGPTGPWVNFTLAAPGSCSPGAITGVSRKSETMESCQLYSVLMNIDLPLTVVHYCSDCAWQVWWIAPNGSVQSAFWYEGFVAWKFYELAGPGSAAIPGAISCVSRKPGHMEVWWVKPDGGMRAAFFYDDPPWRQFDLVGPGSAAIPGAITAVSRKTEAMEVRAVIQLVVLGASVCQT
eukprot:jgi/Chrzof1/11498/UNPLg00430.t1